MKFMYRIGSPGWKFFARHGASILIPVQVLHDKEVGVVVITSRSLRGLVVEIPDTATAEEAHREVDACVDSLMRELLREAPKARPVTAWQGDFQPA